MPHVLLIEDDSAQRRLRALLLESHGYRVTAAASPGEALGLLSPPAVPPDAVLMDLRLPSAEDGRRLIRAVSARYPQLPVVVLSGSPAALERCDEAGMVRAVLRKPVRTEALLRALSRLAALLIPWLLWMPAAAQQRTFPFSLDRAAEVVAELELASPSSDWAAPGREAAVAAVTVDGHTEQHVFVFGEKDSRRYRVFLGPLAPGAHILAVSRDGRHSAEGSNLVIGEARIRALEPGSPEDELVRLAPVLFSRKDAEGRFSDVPLLVYATRGRDATGAWIEYTAVFSNEDGGTSTRDLMARWGRTTDIEYVYRVWPGTGGAPRRTLIQTREHQDVPYDGPYFGLHPLLEPVTDNNMVEPAARPGGSLRFQLAPVLAEAGAGSRERMMDAEPFTYEIACKELEREGKIRPAGSWFEGEKIADPRRYFVAEFHTETENAAVQFLYRLRGEAIWRGSALGIAKNFIERDGWVRTAVELPEGRTPADIGEIAFECLSRRDLERQPVPKNGRCRIAHTGRAFSFDARCRPVPARALPQPPAEGWQLRVGEMVSFRSE
ncbi:MAG: response regulator [Bryobacteraceae bacterium]|nr:response regulator [Bryobacteraceae bacterium]